MLLIDNKIEFRLACYRDVYVIASIMKSSFPYSYKWSLQNYARQWLYNIINSNGCELWVALNNNDICGVLILVDDYDKFNSVNKCVKLKIKLFLNLFLNIVKFNYSFVKGKLFFKNKYVNMNFNFPSGDISKSISIEQVAVSKNSRGLGIGSFLIDFSIERSRKLGFGSICLRVDKNNIAAYSLYLKKGFIPL